MIDYLRYVALRPFVYEGTPVVPGDTLPTPIDPYVLRSLLRTGMIDKVLPEEDVRKVAGAFLRARRTQKEQNHEWQAAEQ